ncbi:MAG: hypothetical protein Q7N50_00710 [Armatimonadota bacterium]|nr:hypothetical protein [Armatimonadota bacterium]
MNQLVLALQAALAIVILLVLWELLRLRRAVQSAQVSLPDLDKIRRMDKSIKESAERSQSKATALAERLEQLCLEAEYLSTSDGHAEPEADLVVDEPVAMEPSPAPEDDAPKRGPRVLSEAGRAKYDRVLHLAAQGLDAGSIAREVDLTRAEVELMLDAAS